MARALTFIRNTPNADNQYPECCKRCGGSGHIETFNFVEGGVCFQCRGVGIYGWVSEEAYKAQEAVAVKRIDARRRKQDRIRAKAETTLREDVELSQAFDVAVSKTVVLSIWHQLHNKGQISEAQRNAVLKIAEGVRQYKAVIAASKAKAATLGMAKTGRYEISGKVKSTKEVASDFGVQFKMLVELESGAKVFGTVPRALGTVEAGDRVVFTATITPKEPGFSFFSRPSKARRK